MADITSARSGGFDVIASEALPSVASPQNIFANAPAETRVILLTLRGAGVTIRFDTGSGLVRYEEHDALPEAPLTSPVIGAALTDPIVGESGHDYPVSYGGPYEFVLSADQAKRVRAVQNGGTATGWITYLRVA